MLKGVAALVTLETRAVTTCVLAGSVRAAGRAASLRPGLTAALTASRVPATPSAARSPARRPGAAPGEPCAAPGSGQYRLPATPRRRQWGGGGGGAWGGGGLRVKKTKEGRKKPTNKRDTPLRLTPTEAPPHSILKRIRPCTLICVNISPCEQLFVVYRTCCEASKGCGTKDCGLNWKVPFITKRASLVRSGVSPIFR